MSMTGKLASVVGKRAKFEDCFVVTIEVGIVEIVEADTLVVAASASVSDFTVGIVTVFECESISSSEVVDV